MVLELQYEFVKHFVLSAEEAFNSLKNEPSRVAKVSQSLTSCLRLPFVSLMTVPVNAVINAHDKASREGKVQSVESLVNDASSDNFWPEFYRIFTHCGLEVFTSYQNQFSLGVYRGKAGTDELGAIKSLARFAGRLCFSRMVDKKLKSDLAKCLVSLKKLLSLTATEQFVQSSIDLLLVERVRLAGKFQSPFAFFRTPILAYGNLQDFEEVPGLLWINQDDKKALAGGPGGSLKYHKLRGPFQFEWITRQTDHQKMPFVGIPHPMEATTMINSEIFAWEQIPDELVLKMKDDILASQCQTPMSSSTTKCSDDSSSTQPKYFRFNVPDPMDLFYEPGRQKFLTHLDQMTQKMMLQPEKDSPSKTVISQLKLIHGMGGVGKIEVVKMFVNMHGHKFDNVVWLEADTQSSLTESFHQLAKCLKVTIWEAPGILRLTKKIAGDVYTALGSHGRTSLVIFDNAHNFDTVNGICGIEPFMPSSMSPDTKIPIFLATSRNKAWSLEGIAGIELMPFNEDDSIKFIYCQLMLDDPNEELNDDPNDDAHDAPINYTGTQTQTQKDIKSLVDAIGGLPLALHQATTYIRRQSKMRASSVTPNQIKMFNEKFLKCPTSQLKSDLHRTNWASVYVTFDVTLDVIRQTHYGSEAIRAIQFLSFLSPDKVPIRLLMNILGDNLQHHEDQTEEEDDNVKEEKEERILTGLNLLDQYSMIRLDTVGNIGVHRIVQQVIRAHLSEPEKMKIVTKLIEKFNSLFNGPFWGSLNLYQQIVGQVMHLVHTHVDLVPPQKEALRQDFLVNILKLLREKGSHDEALDLITKDMKWLERVCAFPSGHASMVRLESEKATVFIYQGSYKEAEETLEPLLKLEIQGLQGHDLNSFAMVKYYAAVLKIYQKKHPTAIELLREAYAMQSTQSGLDKGPHNFDSMTTLHDQAFVLTQQKEFDQALSIYDQVVTWQQKFLNKNHPDVLKTQQNMGDLYSSQGKHQMALEVYKQIHVKQVKLLGAEHPDVITTENNMAAALRQMGQVEEALKVYEGAFEKSPRVFTSDHPVTLTMLHNVAMTMTTLGRFDEAWEKLKTAYKGRKQKLGELHPNTITTRMVMAMWFSKQGDVAKAIEMVVNIRDQLTADPGADDESKEYVKAVLKQLQQRL